MHMKLRVTPKAVHDVGVMRTVLRSLCHLEDTFAVTPLLL